MARKRRTKEETKQVDALVERLREFVRFNYVTAAEVAREIGVNDSTVYSWLLGQARPAEPKRVAAFLDSFPRQNGSGIAPVGYLSALFHWYLQRGRGYFRFRQGAKEEHIRCDT
jgi:hypothetical protein